MLGELFHDCLHLWCVQGALRVISIGTKDANCHDAGLGVKVMKVVRLVSFGAQLPTQGFGRPLDIAHLQFIRSERTPYCDLQGVQRCIRARSPDNTKVVWTWWASLRTCTHAGQHGAWEGARVAFVDLFDNLQLGLRGWILWAREVPNQHNTSALCGADVSVVQLRVTPNHFLANGVRVRLMFSASDRCQQDAPAGLVAIDIGAGRGARGGGGCLRLTLRVVRRGHSGGGGALGGRRCACSGGGSHTYRCGCGGGAGCGARSLGTRRWIRRDHLVPRVHQGQRWVLGGRCAGRRWCCGHDDGRRRSGFRWCGGCRRSRRRPRFRGCRWRGRCRAGRSRNNRSTRPLDFQSLGAVRGDGCEGARLVRRGGLCIGGRRQSGTA